MHDPHYFPEASEPDVLVRGHLVPASWASAVRIGWLVGAAYFGLLLASFLAAFNTQMSASAVAFGSVELLLVAWFVVGTRQWRFPAAMLLCLHPIASIVFYGIGSPGLPVLGTQFGPPHLFTVPIVVSFVGLAAKIIYAFERGIAG